MRLLVILFFSLYWLLYSCQAQPPKKDPLLTEAYQIIQDNYYDPVTFKLRISDEQLKRCAGYAGSQRSINCLTDALGDPYTRLLAVNEAEQETQNIESSILSYGLMFDAADPHRVILVQPGSAAQKAKIQIGDELQSINGLPVKYMDEDEYSAYFRSAAILKLDLRRKYLFYDVVLKPTELQTIPISLQLLAPKITYIKINDLLSKDAADQFLAVLKEPMVKNSSAMVLDLRDNHGGLYQNAIMISDQLLDRGQIIMVENHQGRKTVLADPNRFYTKPIFLLIDQRTASAAEIIASALKNNHRAVLIGTKTYGKGFIQRIKTLSDGSLLHVTILKFYSADGQEIDQLGVIPDFVKLKPSGQLSEALRLATQSK